jgi:hypothetical protein
MKIIVLNNYLGWKPVKHVVFKDDALCDVIHTCNRNPIEYSPLDFLANDYDYVMNYPLFFYNFTDRSHSGTKTVEGAEPTTMNCNLIAKPGGVNQSAEVDAEVAAIIRLKSSKPKVLFDLLKRS